MKGNKLFASLHSHTGCYDIGISSISKEALHPESDKQLESEEPWLKCRYIITVVGFFFFFSINAYRMNMSVAIVAMVNNTALSNHTEITADSCPVLFTNTTNENMEDGSDLREFRWSPKLQGFIQGSYYLTYLIVQVPVGKLVERYGCKWFFFWGTLIAALATVFIPVASRSHPYALIVMQIFRGIGQGVYQPATSLLAANWFPKMERGLLYTIMKSGASLGAFLGSIFAGLLCESTLLGGWPSSFYVYGVAGLILSVAIPYHLHESPSVHPRISQAELKYILSNQENALSQRRPEPPWCKIFTSVPVYALAIGYFGQLWAISQYLIVHSTFLGTILHYPIKQTGFLSALPFLLQFLFSQFSGILSSILTNRNYASVDQARKACHFTSCLGVSVCLLGLYFAGCNRSWSSAVSILLLGFSGVGSAGVWIVSTDMTPTFAASVNAVCCTLGLLPSFIVPLVVGYITNESQTLEQWNKVFFIAIGIVMASGIIFSVFGSAEIQPWNHIEEKEKELKVKNERF